MRNTVLALALPRCLPALAAPAQPEKMRACNADAAKQALKGDARKKFVTECRST
jgi:hypothetical protein